MSTFETIKNKVKGAATATVDATKQFAIVSKCKIKISTEQDKIRALYAELGKLYYKDYVTDEEPDEAEYMPLCDRISAHYRKIACLRQRMNQAKNNYQGVKQEAQEAKQQATAEEEQLITLATARPELPAPSNLTTDEQNLLDELNNLNNETPYGEILD